MACGRYLFLNRSISNSFIDASKQGDASKRLAEWWRRSSKMCRSSSEASAFLAPTRTHVCPLKRIGGIVVGKTSMTTTSPSSKENFSMDMEGCGSKAPSVFSPPSAVICSSEIFLRESCPLSSTPRSKYPGTPRPGRSLANAQIACPILSALSKARVRSTISDSRSVINCISFSFVNILLIHCGSQFHASWQH